MQAMAEPVTATVEAADLSDRPSISRFAQLMARVSRARDADQVMDLFLEAMGETAHDSGHCLLSLSVEGGGGFRVLRHLAPGGVEKRGSSAGDEGDASRVKRGGFLGTLITEGEPRLWRWLDVPDDPAMGGALADYGSGMAAPVYVDGRVAQWTLIFSGQGDAFSESDLEGLVLRANLLQATLRSLQAAQQLRKAHEDARREVEHIAAIQQALLPATLPRIPGLRMAASYETFDRAGGDLYLVQPLDRTRRDGDGRTGGGAEHGDACTGEGDRRWAIMVADAAGHGPAAAVLMAMVESIVAAFPGQPTGPGEILGFANRHLAIKRIEGTFVTAVLAIYDPTTQRLTYANAGHPPPLIRRPHDLPGVAKRQRRGEGEASVSRLDAVGSLPLGIDVDERYEEASILLARGETVALYTDGIFEARSPGGDMFGVAGVERALRECRGTAGCFVATLGSQLRAFQGRGRPEDDQTMLALEGVEIAPPRRSRSRGRAVDGTPRPGITFRQ